MYTYTTDSCYCTAGINTLQINYIPILFFFLVINNALGIPW